MYIEIINYLLDAQEMVSAWELPEDAISEAVKQQACLMAGIDPQTLTPLFED